MKIITMDCGTSATRASVWSWSEMSTPDRAKCLGHARQEVGVREEDKSKVSRALSQVIHDAGGQANIAISEVEYFLASGMITSNLGLAPMPALRAPMDVHDLAHGMQVRTLPEVCAEPIHVIPGMQNDPGASHYESLDRMRGEECEAFGLLSCMNLSGPVTLVLPGSHGKMVLVDAHNRIIACRTTISGELLDQLTHHTVLADALEHRFAQKILPQPLLEGFRYGSTFGLTHGAFMVRLQHLAGNTDVDSRANFLLGLVLASDIQALRTSAFAKGMQDPIVVAGHPIVRGALVVLLREAGWQNVVEFAKNEDLAGRGALAVLHHHLAHHQHA